MLVSPWTCEGNSISYETQPIPLVKFILLGKSRPHRIMIIKSIAKLVGYALEIVKKEMVVMCAAILVVMQIGD